MNRIYVYIRSMPHHAKPVFVCITILRIAVWQALIDYKGKTLQYDIKVDLEFMKAAQTRLDRCIVIRGTACLIHHLSTNSTTEVRKAVQAEIKRIRAANLCESKELPVGLLAGCVGGWLAR